jgi:cation diffusion facilitator CzcD-associated flavoprotein CzcO
MAKRIVIIGAGPAGVFVANGLADIAAKGSVEITILERKDHLDLCLGQPRCMVNAAFADEALPTHDRVLHGSKKPRVIAIAGITSVSSGEVAYTTRAGGAEAIKADAVVIATGSTYKGKYIKNNDGLSKQEWLGRVSEWRAAAAKANHIVVIGTCDGCQK